MPSATVVFCPDSYCRGLASSLRIAAATHGIAINEVSEAAFSMGQFIGQECTRWNEVIVLATWTSYVFDLYQVCASNPNPQPARYALRSKGVAVKRACAPGPQCLVFYHSSLVLLRSVPNRFLSIRGVGRSGWVSRPSVKMAIRFQVQGLNPKP